MRSAIKFLIPAFLWLRPSHHQTETETVKRILFIKFWGIGSVVLTEPALRWLRQAYPEAEIHYLTFSKNAPLVRLIPAVSRIHTLPFYTLGSFTTGCFALLPRLRRERYDLILDGEFFCNFSGLVSYLAAPRARIIGFARPGSCKSRLQRVSIPFLSERHVASQFLSLARAATLNSLSVKGFQTTPSVRMPDAGDKRLVPFHLHSRRPYVVINVNASPLAIERRWPRSGFIQLARSLLARHAFDLVLIGSRKERLYVAAVEAELNSPGRIQNLCGLTDIVQLASLVRDAVMVVSNDSGPVHLASAFDVPVVAFYGPETPELYGPLSSRKLVFYERLWCSPCMSVENAKSVNCINHRACMKGIDPARVIAAVHRFIETDVLTADSGIYRKDGTRHTPMRV